MNKDIKNLEKELQFWIDNNLFQKDEKSDEMMKFHQKEIEKARNEYFAKKFMQELKEENKTIMKTFTIEKKLDDEIKNIIKQENVTYAKFIKTALKNAVEQVKLIKSI